MCVIQKELFFDMTTYFYEWGSSMKTYEDTKLIICRYDSNIFS